jgi:myo-inositol 2-dehydrogenase/D-chiro-inositol 1-dehydrogenase
MRIGLIGAGRIARMHAQNLLELRHSSLGQVFDPSADRAQELAERGGARIAGDVSEIIAGTGCDAIVIASPTETHIPLMLAAAKVGKPVYCEKPLAKTLDQAQRAVDELERLGARVMIGFNRRFDEGHALLRGKVGVGEIGRLQTLQITTRGPNGVPTLAYLVGSGGLFRDKCIHYLDLARWIAGEEPVAVAAMGSVLADEVFNEASDFDTGIVSLRFASGALCQIDVGRRAVYGYDDRIEAFGTKGLAKSGRVRRDSLTTLVPGAVTQSRFPQDSTERYRQSWMSAMAAFEGFAMGLNTDVPTLRDGLAAQRLAEAATISAMEGRLVRLEEVGG